MRAEVRGLLLLATALASGCLSLRALQGPAAERYEPVAPTGARGGSLTAQLESVAVSSDDQTAVITLTAQADEAASFLHATLSSAAASPCAAGVAASAVALDGQKRWDRPVGIKGRHTVALTVVDATPLLQQDPEAVLDLQLAGNAADSCLRISLGTPAPPPALRPAPAWSVGGVLRASFPTSVGPYQYIDDELRVSYRLGRLAVGAELGWALSGCTAACPLPNTTQVPSWLLVEIVPARARGFGVGVEAAYGLTYAFSGKSSDPDAWLHGPRLALHLLKLSPALLAAGATAPTGKGVEVSLAYQRALDGPVRPMLVVGVGLVAF